MASVHSFVHSFHTCYTDAHHEQHRARGTERPQPHGEAGGTPMLSSPPPGTPRGPSWGHAECGLVKPTVALRPLEQRSAWSASGK